MRVLQLIDSLRPGGAEKMAVNIANALLPHVEKSYLCCTRKEGLLKSQLKNEVHYLFLNKRYSLDQKAFLKLRAFIIRNEIGIVHAHSTSYFLAGLLKLSGSKFKLIWHDHYGESELLDKRKFFILKIFSKNFFAILSVNSALKNWALMNLNCNNVFEIKNFVPVPHKTKSSLLKLSGSEADFKVICVANLRPQKDHMNILKAFELLDPHLSVSLHLIGEDPGSEFSRSLLLALEATSVKNKIYYYGAQPIIFPLLQEANLGILGSRSEGLPLALLEYGLAGLPVVCTKVGKCMDIIGDNGIIVPPNDPVAMAQGILEYYNDDIRRKRDSAGLKKTIEEIYSSGAFLENLMDIYKKA